MKVHSINQAHVSESQPDSGVGVHGVADFGWVTESLGRI